MEVKKDGGLSGWVRWNVREQGWKKRVQGGRRGRKCRRGMRGPESERDRWERKRQEGQRRDS